MVAIWVGVNGYLDDIPTADVPRFQEELRDYLRADEAVYTEILETSDLADELEAKLKEQVEKFKQGFNVEASDSLVSRPDGNRPRPRSAGFARSRTRRRSRRRVGARRLRAAAARAGAIEVMRPYADKMLQLMAGVARASVPKQRLPLLQRREPQTTAILAITGDRGLAGGFNAQILRRAFALGRELEGEGQTVRWLASGRKGRSTSPVPRLRPGSRLDGLQRPALVRRRAGDRPPARRALRRGEVDRVIVVYNHFGSALVQTVTEQEVLPIPEHLLETDEEERHEDACAATSSTSRSPRRSSSGCSPSTSRPSSSGRFSSRRPPSREPG